MKRPNILVIMSDEHTASVMGAAGDSIVQSPNLDELAQKGVLFENCYTPSPICVPARLAFTVGKYVSKCGMWSNQSKFDTDDIPSVASLLRDNGYECYLGGKMHYAPDRRYGFEELFPSYANKRFRKAHPRRVDLSDSVFFEKESELSPRFQDFYTGERSIILDHDKKVTKYCTELIENRRPDDNPMMLIAGYIAPHFPLIVPQKYHDMYRNQVPMPHLPGGHIDMLPTHYQVMRKSFKVDMVPDELTKLGRELYYGLVTWFDEQVGQLLGSLEDSQISENTIVIYTSDHGENMGDHGLWWKNSMYDCSTKIPLIVSWPERWGRGKRRTEICSLLDVVQTIMEATDTPTPKDWDGHSMINLLDERDSKWKNYAISEYYANNIASGHCMIRNGDFKYVYFNRINDQYPEARQLFNLKEDPGEFNNLAADSRYAALIKEMHTLLVGEIGREPEAVEEDARKDIDASHERVFV